MSLDNCIPHIGTLGGARQGLAAAVRLLALFVTAGCGGSPSSVTKTGGGGGGGQPVAAAVSSMIAVGTRPSGIAVDSTNNKIHVADFGSETPTGGITCAPSGADIRVIDGVTQSTTSMNFTFFVPSASWNPYAIAVNTANQTLYVVAALFGPNFRDVCSFVEDGVELFNTTIGSQSSNIGTLITVAGLDVNLGTDEHICLTTRF